MTISRRMEHAIQKLYTAFHSGNLNPDCSMQCAVGNICDRHDYWKHFTDLHGSVKLNYVGKVNEAFGKKFNGYLPLELLKIEAEFLLGCGYSLPIDRSHKNTEVVISKEILFQGLSKVVSFLCVLDRIPDIMDCSQLFDFGIEEDKENMNCASVIVL
ncbi:MAG: hypothetical protein ACI9AT_001832 [Ulvibacter sp.]|jgi:hypothetical protein